MVFSVSQPLVTMFFNGYQPLVQRCDGNDTSLWSTQVSLAPTHDRCKLVGPYVTLSNLHSITVSGPSQRVRRDLWPWDIWSEWWVEMSQGCMDGGLNASWVGLYGGSNARKCMMAAVLFKNIYKVECAQKSGGVRRHKCFWGCMLNFILCRPKYFSKMCMKAWKCL